jgi:hypothetical protein
MNMSGYAYNAHLISRRDIWEFLLLSDSGLNYCGPSLVYRE